MGIGSACLKQRPKKNGELSKNEMMMFTSETHFNEEQIRAVLTHFRLIAKTIDDDGVIDYAEFCEAICLPHSCLSSQIFRVFDLNKDGKLNFWEFLVGLSTLCSGDDRELRKLAFRIYDIDEDDLISSSELKALFSASVQSNAYSEVQIDLIVQDCFAAVDTNMDGYIDEQEFEALIAANPSLLASLRLDPQVLQGFEKKVSKCL
eukprot:Platyproteum_vivax@DN3606_c0_g1_i1.p1